MKPHPSILLFCATFAASLTTATAQVGRIVFPPGSGVFDVVAESIGLSSGGQEKGIDKLRSLY